MKIKRIIAAVMALVLVGGTYPFAAEKTVTIEKAFAEEADAAESSVKFATAKQTLMQNEPVKIYAKNIDTATCKYKGQNTRKEKMTKTEDGCVFEFKANEAGEAKFVVEYIEDGIPKQKEFLFTVTEEEYTDENSVVFACEKKTLMQNEPVKIYAKNIDTATCKYKGQNTRKENMTVTEDGCVFEFKAFEAGEAKFAVEYIEDGLPKQKEFLFTVSEAEYKDENSVEFACEKTSLMQNEPIKIYAKNIDTATCKYKGQNIRKENMTVTEDGCVFEFKAFEAGEAKFVVEYIEDGLPKQKEFLFTVSEAEYKDENSVEFACEKTALMQNEPIKIYAKNIDTATCKYKGQNIRKENMTVTEDGCVFEFKAFEAGEAKFVVEYIEDGLPKQKEFLFTVSEAEYKDENSVEFACEKTIVNKGEAIRIFAKNLGESDCKFTTLPVMDYEMERTGDSCVYEFMTFEAGEAKIVVEYIEDELPKQKEFIITVTDEEKTEARRGDSNCDGIIDMGDVVLIMQALANPQKYGLNGSSDKCITAQGLKNSDVDDSIAGVTNNDALKIQKFLLGIETEL